MLGTLVSTLGLRVGRPLTMSAAPSPAGGPLCPLKGRNFSAYLGEDVIGMAIVRYKVDLTNFLEEGPRNKMVVEALVAPPELPRDAHEMVRMGLQNSLIELGQCHDMCVEFCSCHSDRDSAT